MRLIDADGLLVRFTNAIRSNNKSRGIKYILSLPLSEGLEIVLNQAETIDPVKHGHWVKRNSIGSATCSICGALITNFYDKNSNKYCHVCGAKMDGDKDAVN